MARESEYETYLVKQCKKHNILCYKFVSPGINGVPDRILLYNGKCIFVEMKQEKGRLSPSQKVRIKHIQQQGFTVYVPYSKKDIDKCIQQIVQ